MTDVVKEKAIIFLKGVFLKIGVNDAAIQKEVTNLFLPVITEIMRTIPYNKRITTLSPLLTCVSYFIGYQEKIRKNKQLSDLNGFDTFNTFIINTYTQFTKALLEILLAKENRSHCNVKSIINMAFIDDLVCDLGDKLIQYHAMKDSKNKDLIVRLENDIKLLLNDYNDVSGELPLTFHDITSKD